jgi:hypothetical protein
MEPIPHSASACLARSSPFGIGSLLLLLLLGSLPLLAQDAATSKWAALFANHYALPHTGGSHRVNLQIPLFGLATLRITVGAFT